MNSMVTTGKYWGRPEEDFEERIEKALEAADFAYWAEIIKHFPEVKTGDFPPYAAFDWRNSQRTAMDIWLEMNYPRPTEPE